MYLLNLTKLVKGKLQLILGQADALSFRPQQHCIKVTNLFGKKGFVSADNSVFVR